MKVHCITCGHQIDLDDDSYQSYHGPLRCWVCRSVLDVSIVGGRVESVSLPAMAAPRSGSAAVAPMRTKAVKEANHD